MMPASRAVSSGSPFLVFRARTCFNAAADMVIRPRAVASRTVAAFPDTSTIRILPAASTCDSPDVRPPVLCLRALLIGVTLHEEERQALERNGQVRVLQLHAARNSIGARREVEDRAHPRGRDGVDRRLRGG